MKTTPIGTISGFVALEKPSTKFNEDGVYTCEMEFTGDALTKMKAEIERAMRESKKIGAVSGVMKQANPPYKVENDILTVKFKQKAKIMSRKGQSYDINIKIYDAEGTKVDKLLNIGQGTTCKIAYNNYMWAVSSTGCGLTLQPTAVQILELVERSDNSINPFNKEEAGTFVAAKKNVNPFKLNDIEESDADF